MAICQHAFERRTEVPDASTGILDRRTGMLNGYKAVLERRIDIMEREKMKKFVCSRILN